MKSIKIFSLFLLVPTVAFGATRADSTVRVGMNRISQTGARLPATGVASPVVKGVDTVVESDEVSDTEVVVKSSSSDVSETTDAASCRDAYRECMDSFCLLDENQGERCACSDNIERAKPKINEVLAIQAEADKLFTEGVEREKLGAKAQFVFDNDSGKKISGIDFMSWLTDGESEQDGDVGEDVEIGDGLYQKAQKYCANDLKLCGDRAEMEEMLYSRMITNDCKSYDAYLRDQKANAESNKRIAESAVRKAKLEMFDTTNKYNRGECLLAYRACISDKGGCGANFENCLDEGLLQRRANSCENILDQCMAVRNSVLKDWADESKSVLADAAKYADVNKRGTCLAKIQNCLEESCSTSTNAECLTNVDVAAEICPIITECEKIIPGLRDSVNDKLGYLQTKFCENDVSKCLQDRCGVDYTKPECVGKKAKDIAALCPQNMFPSCKTATQFNIIVQSAMLQMDYQMLTGCVNYFAEKLNKTCGADMSCLSAVPSATAFDNVPSDEKSLKDLRAKVIKDSAESVDDFFKQFEQDKTVAACADSQSGDESKRLKDKNSLGTDVFNAAKFVAKMSVERRNLREMESKIAELSRKADLETAKQNCLTTYKVETPNKSQSNYMYIKSVAFEPSLRNCHVCRMQQVCEEGGETKMDSAKKMAAYGTSTFGAAGAAINPVYGTAIGAALGAGIFGLAGYFGSDGTHEYCQQVESCEDVNM